MGDQQGSLAAGIELLQRLAWPPAEVQSLLFKQPRRANEDAGLPRSASDAGTGMGLEFVDGIERQMAGLGFADDEPASRCSLRCSTAAATRSTSSAERRQADHIAQFQPAFGEGAGLVEGERRDLGEPFQGGTAFEQHARPRQPAQRRDDRGRRRQDQRTGTCHHQHRHGGDQALLERIAEPNRTAEQPDRKQVSATPKVSAAGQTAGRK